MLVSLQDLQDRLGVFSGSLPSVIILNAFFSAVYYQFGSFGCLIEDSLIDLEYKL